MMTPSPPVVHPLVRFLRRRWRLVLSCGVVLMVVAVTALAMVSRQRDWFRPQMKRAIALRGYIVAFHAKYGEYPEKLDDLRLMGVISPEEFNKLRFQRTVLSSRRDWIYRKPLTKATVILHSPEPVPNLIAGGNYTILVWLDTAEALGWGKGYVVKKLLAVP